jgi:hypothetical protein
MDTSQPHYSDIHKIVEVYRQINGYQDTQALTEEALGYGSHRT